MLPTKDSYVDLSKVNYSEVEVDSISTENAKTFDFEVENEHHYILANGLVSHNSSVICNSVSNGIEPIFDLEYERKKICKKWPKGLTQDNIKTVLKYHKENNYVYYRGEYKGKEYHYEEYNRGLCEVSVVRDYGYQWLLNNFPEEDYSKYLVTTSDLNIDDHLNIQKAVQHYCNQSVSKTINLPSDYPFKDFKKLYVKAWKMGLNGFTTYRMGSMESVLSSVKSKEKKIIAKDIKLPPEFNNGPTKIIKKEGIKFYMNFSYLPEDTDKEFPVVIWIHTNARYKGEDLKTCNKASRNLAKLALSCGIDAKIVNETVSKANKDYPHNRLGRLISLCLRHNIPIEDILGPLMNVDGDNITTLLTAVRKFLAEIVPDGTILKGAKCENKECTGTGTNIILNGGCKECRDCGWSGCG